MKKEILTVAEKAFKSCKKNKIDAVFDEQWYIIFYDFWLETDRTFAVIDAEGIGTIDGFDFEEI
jgi:hypothetical protein